MTEWSNVFLGIIAGAVLVMALIQVGAIVAGARLAQRVNRLAEQVERDMGPLVANLHTIGAEAARASALATAQVERADRLFADVSAKVEEATSVVQQVIMAPATRGARGDGRAAGGAVLAARCPAGLVATPLIARRRRRSAVHRLVDC